MIMKMFGRLSPSWRFREGKKIWRILPDGEVLAVELRDTEAKTTSFAAIGIDSGKRLWDNPGPGDNWWTTLNAIHRGVLLLQQFVKPDMPNVGKIFAVDVKTGSLLWQNDSLTFLFAKDDLVYGLRRTLVTEEVAALDWMTGAERARYNASEFDADRVSTGEPVGYLLPDYPDEENRDDGTSTGSGKVFPVDAVSPTMIRTESGKLVAGYHMHSGTDKKGVPLFDSHLVIVSAEGREIYSDIADKGVYMPLADIYLVSGNRLIYVKNSDEVVAVRLD